MKKLLISLISVLLIFTFCGKNSTDSNNEEDIIKLEILVKENDTPQENLFIEVTATVQESVKNRAEGDEVISYPTTVVNNETTNSYGKAIFTYENKSLPNDGGIYIEKVVIKRINTVLITDEEEKFIKKGKAKILEYDLTQ